MRLPVLFTLLALLHCLPAKSQHRINPLQGRASGSAGFFGSSPRDISLWRSAVVNTMKQVKNVSWSLDWNEVTDGTAPRLADNPDLQGTETQMMQLVQCINDKHNQTAEMSWQSAMDDQPSSLRVVASWWRNHAPIQESMTVVTSASVSRLPQIYAQCLSWSGPLSAVLYQALPSPHSSPANQAILRTAVLQISQFVLDMQHVPGACKPDLILAYEIYNDEAARKLLYPFNLLRNMARLQARTPLLALVDVDLVLSRSLATRMSSIPRATWVLNQALNNKTVFIIPAFDVRGQHERAAWADALVSSTKEMLVFAYSKGIVCPFQHDAYPEGHALTDHQFWKTAGGDYPVQHQFRCEPWLVGAAGNLPWHDSRYRGYGLDKVQFVADVAAHGFTFRVLHDVFTIHRAHKKGAARDVYILGKISKTADPSLYQHNWNLYSRQNELKDKGQVWTPSLNPATEHCLAVLPWLKKP